jgi:hypothetical protein
MERASAARLRALAKRCEALGKELRAARYLVPGGVLRWDMLALETRLRDAASALLSALENESHEDTNRTL